MYQMFRLQHIPYLLLHRLPSSPHRQVRQEHPVFPVHLLQAVKSEYPFFHPQKYMQVLFPSHLPVLYPVFRFHQSPSPDNLPENNNHPLPDILPQPARHTYMFLM